MVATLGMERGYEWQGLFLSMGKGVKVTKKNRMLPYTGTQGHSEVSYSQIDEEELYSTEALRDHANKSILNLQSKVENLKVRNKTLEDVAKSWMDDYQTLKDKYEPEKIIFTSKA